MTPHCFRGYGVGADDVTIVLERITHWHHISYNGNIGTEIHLDTGKTIRVGAYHSEVDKAIRSAITAVEQKAGVRPTVQRIC